MMSASTAASERGREKTRRASRGETLTDLRAGRTPQLRRITPMTLGDMFVSGAKSPVPRRGEGVEQGLLAMKLRQLKMEEGEGEREMM